MQDNQSARVMVYRYLYWEEGATRRKASTLYATLEMIRNGLGVPVYPTGIDVARSELRDGGLYVPPQIQAAKGDS